jgi:transposase
MRARLYVRPLTSAEEEAVQRGLHSADAFTLRRCQILRASAQGLHAAQIAAQLGCGDQTVRNALQAFNSRGLAALTRISSARPAQARAFDDAALAKLTALLEHSPRDFGQPQSLWTLPLVAQVCVAEGITAQAVSRETVRQALLRLGQSWQRAKQWVTSPDPRYQRKKAGATG